MEVHNANRNPVLSEDNNRGIKVCEAVNCYEAATETIIVSAGKFGTINLNLCYRCEVTKFQTRVKTTRDQLVPIESKFYCSVEATE